MQPEQTFETVREALRRGLSPLVAWIPDVTAFPPRRQAAIGAGVSVCVHLLVLLFFIIGALVIPERVDPPRPAPAAPLRVQLVPMPKPLQADPLQPKRTQLIEAKGLEASKEAPLNPDFETDRNIVAGSKLPATGPMPVPSQAGRTDIPGQEFANQPIRVGVTPDAQPETLRPEEAKEKPAAAQPPPMAPLYQPQPVTPEALAAAQAAKPTEKIAEPAKPLKATPPPLKFTDTPRENSIAMRTATPKPVVAATPFAVASLPMATPSKSITSRYEANMVKTEIKGAVDKLGPNGVNAKGTPMGIYNRRLGEQVQTLWRWKIGSVGELGTVRVRVKLRSDGTVQATKVLNDGGSPVHTEICLQVIRELRPVKMPPEAEPFLEDGTMEITFSFTLF